MRIRVAAVGTRLPDWQQRGFQEYARRLPKACALELVEVPAATRGKSTSTERAKARESERLLTAVNGNDLVIALDQSGREYTTEGLAALMEDWLARGRSPAMLIGGADGLSDACRTRAEMIWSLSKLTLPHGIVRVLVAEQVYRAWSILRNHPYHRGE